MRALALERSPRVSKAPVAPPPSAAPRAGPTHWFDLATRTARPPSEGPTLQRMCSECEEETLHRRAESDDETGGRAPALVGEVLRSGGGQPLDPSTRAWFELRFGRDLGGVRVHTDDRASDSARAVHALAYTVGQDVVFRQGYFAPGTPRGRELLAHELAHAAQQGPVSNLDGLTLSRPGDAGERAAEAAASRVESGPAPQGPIPLASGAGLQRQADDEPAAQGPGASPGAAPDEQSCEGWESDPESFAIVAANRLFRGKLGRSSSIMVTRVTCDHVDSCRVTYSNGESVEVVFIFKSKKVSANIDLPNGKNLLCFYDYRCLRSGRLVLEGEDCMERFQNPYR